MSPKLFFLTIMAILALIHIAINSHSVEFRILWQENNLPLSVITLFAMAFGMLFGMLYLSFIRTNQEKKRQMKEIRKENRKNKRNNQEQKSGT